MYRANQFNTSLMIWTYLFALLCVLIGLSVLKSNLLPSILILETRIKMILAKLQLKERHLLDDIVIRQFGLREGVLIWETTFGLTYKTITYLFVRSINRLLQFKSSK